MLSGPDLLWGGIVPGVIAAAALAAMWRITGKAASTWRTALLLGYVVGHWSLSARDLGAAALLSRGGLESVGANWAYDPRNFDFVAALIKSFQASEAQDWLPLLGLFALVPDAAACIGKIGPAVGWILRVALCLFLTWRLLDGSKYLPLSLGPDFDFDLGGWSTGEAGAWIGGIGAALVVAWQVMRQAQSPDERNDGNLRSVLSIVVAFSCVVTMVSSKSLILGQLLGVLTASLTGCALASAVVGTKRGPDAAAGPIVTLLSALLIAGIFYAELTLLNAGLLLGAMAVSVGWMPLPNALSATKQSAARIVACLALLVAPVITSGRELAGQIPDSETEIEDRAEPNPYENFRP